MADGHGVLSYDILPCGLLAATALTEGPPMRAELSLLFAVAG